MSYEGEDCSVGDCIVQQGPSGELSESVGLELWAEVEKTVALFFMAGADELAVGTCGIQQSGLGAAMQGACNTAWDSNMSI